MADNPNQKWLVRWIDKDGKEQETTLRAVHVSSAHIDIIKRTGGKFLSAKKVEG